MRPSKACLLALSSVLVLALSGADATVVATCKAAADSNKQVTYDFCVSELSKHRGSLDADTSGLAAVAAQAGVSNARKAFVSINDRLGGKGAAGMEEKTRAAFEQCENLYKKVDSAFIRARDMIYGRKYAVGKEQAALAISLAQKCDGLLGSTVAKPSPLTKYSSYTGKIAVVVIAITDLIK